MDVLILNPDRCTGCHDCEEACAERWFKDRDRAKGALQVAPAETGDPYGVIACTQCGDCIDICPTKAIVRDQNGVVVIQKEACVGCLSCVSFCDIWAMRTHPDYVEPFKCVACGRCVEVCPEKALSIQDVADAGPSQTARWEERMDAR